MFNPGLTLFRSEVALGGSGVLRNNPVDGLETRRAANQEDLVRKYVVVDGERHFRILFKSLQFRRLGRSRHDELASIPVKPDRNHPGRSIGPYISEARGNLRTQQFLRDWMLK